MTNMTATRSARDRRVVKAGRGRLPANLSVEGEDEAVMSVVLPVVLIVVWVRAESAVRCIPEVVETIEKFGEHFEGFLDLLPRAGMACKAKRGGIQGIPQVVEETHRGI